MSSSLAPKPISETRHFHQNIPTDTCSPIQATWPALQPPEVTEFLNIWEIILNEVAIPTSEAQKTYQQRIPSLYVLGNLKHVSEASYFIEA